MPGVTTSTKYVAGPNGPVRVRRYRPAGPVRSALVWLHGGAFIAGDLDMPEADWVARRLASDAVGVISVDYRLAVGGVHFPVPGDDVLAVWRWATSTDVFTLGEEPGIGWHVGGASAGGNLAASLAMQARDHGDRPPRSCVLAYPVLHDAMPEPSPDLARRLAGIDEAQRFRPDRCRQLNLNYVGDPANLTHPYAFPAHGDATGLPPTLIVTSDLDDLRPSGQAYAAQLAQAGVDVALLCEAGVTHGHLDAPDCAGARHTMSRILTWLRLVDANRSVAQISGSGWHDPCPR